jgi:hypothetical protein
VSWRNREASYDVAELEPGSRAGETYVLQEYFVPVERFDDWIPRMRRVFRTHRVNVINVSIRHALPDSVSLLAWAPNEVFAFVVYYKQQTDVAAQAKVRTWTRELVDRVLELGGSYYLPYQPHATPAQFTAAYPRSVEFFALKRRLDPGNKFRNSLWNSYDPAVLAAEPPELGNALIARAELRPGYRRPDSDTFLQHPEWYIVYSSEEYGRHLASHPPSTFPYGAAIGQYWRTYYEAWSATRHAFPTNWAYHVMLWVIGTSYSAELALKGTYENTLGRLSEWSADGAHAGGPVGGRGGTGVWPVRPRPALVRVPLSAAPPGGVDGPAALGEASGQELGAEGLSLPGVRGEGGLCGSDRARCAGGL